MNEEFLFATEELRELNMPEEKECHKTPSGAAPCASSSAITKV